VHLRCMPRALLAKKKKNLLTMPHLAEEFPTFQRTWKFVTVWWNWSTSNNIHIMCFFKTHFNIIVAPPTSSTKQPLSIRFSDKNERKCNLSQTCYKPHFFSISFGLFTIKVQSVSFIASLSAVAPCCVPADAEYFCSLKLRWCPGHDKR